HLARDRHQARGRARDLFVDARAGGVQLVGGAVPERDAHGDRTDVEVLGLDHAQRLAQLLRLVDHARSSRRRVPSQPNKTPPISETARFKSDSSQVARRPSKTVSASVKTAK